MLTYSFGHSPSVGEKMTKTMITDALTQFIAFIIRWMFVFSWTRTQLGDSLFDVVGPCVWNKFHMTNKGLRMFQAFFQALL